MPNERASMRKLNVVSVVFGASFLFAFTTLCWSASLFAPTSPLSTLASGILSVPSRVLHAQVQDQGQAPLFDSDSDDDFANTTDRSWTLHSTFSGNSFINDGAFDYEAIPDPTHGRVNYVDKATAVREGLVEVNKAGHFVLRADDKKKVTAGQAGRDSVRIRSKESFEAHLAVFDIKHMPEGCGTWPAVWETLEKDWPAFGEVDILEGVNNQSPNAMTLHTNPGCTMPAQRPMTGDAPANLNDCNHLVNGNAGCSVRSTRTESYGPKFNAAGGGWYVIERTNSYIRVFFWSRKDGNVPEVVKNGGGQISGAETSKWGLPVALFPNTQCDLAKFFGPNKIIINLTFCGDWAGQPDVYRSSGCPRTCNDFVDNEPGAFNEAFFEIASIRVYT